MYLHIVKPTNLKTKSIFSIFKNPKPKNHDCKHEVQVAVIKKTALAVIKGCISRN